MRAREKTNVLIVDDQPANLLVLEGVLDDPGLNLVRAESGEEALKRLQEQEFALVLLDVQMPGMDGFETAALIRELDPDTPIIFLTAIHRTEGHALRGYQVGAVDYLVKPLVPEILRSKVGVFVDLHRRTQQSRMGAGAVPETSGRQWRDLLDQLEQVLFSMDVAEQCITQISPTCELVLGVSPQALYDDPRLWQALVHPDDRLAWGALQQEAARGQVGSGQLRVVRPDGVIRWLQVLLKPTLDRAGRLIHLDGALVDVSARVQTEEALRQKEEQFLQAQKMEVVGLLAGGVVHDFNNIITTIMGNAELLLRRAQDEDPGKPLLEDILNACRRATGLSQRFLSFSRRRAHQVVALDVNGVLQDMDRMLRRMVGSPVSVELVLAPDLPPVMADPGQLEQVVLNLAVNARDAMPHGGRLRLETSAVELGGVGSGPLNVVVTAGLYVLLAVSDTGVGMDTETKAQAFEPFFTTKEEGRGTGLGLTTVYGIAKQCGGHVAVVSEPGQGTTFKLYLPAAPRTARPAAVAPLGEVAHGTETVLVAEDDPGVLETIRGALEADGYAVVTATDGAAALAAAAAHAGRIHLLLTDIVMPGMSGVELARRLRADHPGLQVLYMTGYTEGDAVRGALEEAGTDFMAKPFPPGVLRRKVRAALDAAAGKEAT